MLPTPQLLTFAFLFCCLRASLAFSSSLRVLSWRKREEALWYRWFRARSSPKASPLMKYQSKLWADG